MICLLCFSSGRISNIFHLFHCLPLFFHYFLFILIPLCTRYCILYIAIFFPPSKSNYYLPPQQCNLPAGINCFYLIIFHLAFKIAFEIYSFSLNQHDISTSLIRHPQSGAFGYFLHEAPPQRPIDHSI